KDSPKNPLESTGRLSKYLPPSNQPNVGELKLTKHNEQTPKREISILIHNIFLAEGQDVSLTNGFLGVRNAEHVGSLPEIYGTIQNIVGIALLKENYQFSYCDME
ncbi:hypothetical protein J6590_058314, partial [Homalodisca vitripennis]